MFNLEQAITDWRKQMLAAGVKTPVPLEEFESHLREDIEQEMRLGMTAQQAFEAAVRQIGRAGALSLEFKTVEREERKFMKRMMIVLAGIVGVLVGMAWVTPAVAQYHHEGAMTRESVWLFLLGTVITFTSLGTAIYGFKRRKV